MMTFENGYAAKFGAIPEVFRDYNRHASSFGYERSATNDLHNLVADIELEIDLVNLGFLNS